MKYPFRPSRARAENEQRKSQGRTSSINSFLLDEEMKVRNPLDDPCSQCHRPIAKYGDGHRCHWCLTGQRRLS